MRLEKIFHDELRTPACSSRLQMQIKTTQKLMRNRQKMRKMLRYLQTPVNLTMSIESEQRHKLR
jgi:hypothetical protein